MRTYTYPATLEAGESPGTIIVSFADVPEAITQGDDKADALAEASDALGLTLLEYLRRGRALPKASTRGHMVTPPADVSAKLAVLEAFIAADITQTELASRLDVDAKEVQRILDPMHATKLPRLTAALAAMGQRLVVGVEKVA